LSTPFIISYVALWLLVLILSVAVVALYHHFGQMYLGSREGRQTQGPEQEKRLKSFSGRTVSGTSLDLPLLDTPTVLLFAETHCKLCTAMQPEMQLFARSHDDVQLVVMCGGDSTPEVSEWAREIASDVPILVDEGQRQTARYAVGITPFAVAIGADGVVQAKGIVNDYDGLKYYAQLTSLAELESVV
jgi:hypothetical protein